MFDMEGRLKPDFSTLPEVFVSDARLSAAVSRQVKLGRLRKLGTRLYTRNLSETPERLVQRHLWRVAAYLPGALVADRTALENRPAADGSVFLIAQHKRDIELPGVTLRPRKGPGPLGTDRQFVAGLRISSTARAFLENMRPSRSRAGVARTCSRREIEDRLDDLFRNGGEQAVQKLRDEARELAPDLDLTVEFAQLDGLIGTLLGTRRERLETGTGRARAAGTPYDPLRMPLFQKLFAELAGEAPPTRLARTTDGMALPFYEAYFSNFIEGTEFAVEEAADIVFRGHIPVSRPADAHDVLGTWKIVSDAREMSRAPGSFEEFLELLTRRHSVIMEGRTAKRPGKFKTGLNRAGATVFVSPELVKGTLRAGYEMYRGLSASFPRAIFMMFLIAEVHPFEDGNGRIARIMMNAELVAAGEQRILVPTVYRNNYLMALKALSANGVAAPLVRTMDFAQRYTASIDFADPEEARRLLDETHAFVDPNEAEVTGVRLRLPLT